MEDLLCVKKIDIFQLCSYPCEGKRVVKTAKHGKIFREGNLRPHYHVGAIRLSLNGRITGGGKKTATFRTIAEDPFLPTQSWSGFQYEKRIYLGIGGRFNAKGFRATSAKNIGK